MGIDPKFGRFCDECGETIAKAHRVHLGREYCSSCYPRIFVRTRCTQCQAPVRVHKNAQEPPVCGACIASTRVCLRCAKPTPKAGFVVGDQAVCASCVPYFREKQNCARCGTPSSRLTSVDAAGGKERICEPCRNRCTHQTCSICGKYRRVAATGYGGARCGPCSSDPAVSHSCPTCGVKIPGRGASRCRPCTNLELLQRELTLSRHVFERAWTGDVWVDFGQWLYSRGPGNPRALTLLRSHQPFFERLSANLLTKTELDAKALLELFGTAQLRKHLLPVQYLDERHGVKIAASTKSASAETDRIATLMVQARHEPWVGVLDAYSEQLASAGLTVRTSRMYLSSAASLLRELGVADQAWNNDALERYLARHPGARNNVSRFVTFCRQELRWDVRMKDTAPAVTPLLNPPQSVMKLCSTLQKIDEIGISNAAKSTVCAVIATALGVSARQILSLAVTDIVITPESAILRTGRERIDLPASLRPFAERLLALLKSDLGEA